MRTLYLDLTNGVSADMFVAACYALMNDDAKIDFEKWSGIACKGLGVSIELDEITEDGRNGFMISWLDEKSDGRPRNAKEAKSLLDAILTKIETSEKSNQYAIKVLDDIIDVEAESHSVDRERVHLHEIGRTTGMLNIALSSLCLDLLHIHDSEIVASYISIGDGEIETSHGKLLVPAPATVRLLKGLRFRFGPSEGEMATPTGIAIMRNLIVHQNDMLPESYQEGIGFGTRIFRGKRGYMRIFKSNEQSGAE